MGVTVFTEETSSPVSAARLFKALFLDAHNLVPKLLPQATKSIDILQGDGGAGTIIQINFSEGKYVKHRFDVVDAENFLYKYTLIEGGALSEKIESIVYDIKLETSAGGGNVAKLKIEIHTVGDAAVTEEEVKAAKERPVGLYKVVAAYLLENPGTYA